MQARYQETNTLGRQASPAKTRSTADRTAEKTKSKPVEISIDVPQAGSVAIAGTFNNWDLKKTPLQKDGNGWKATLTLPPGRYEYRFVVDGQWLSDPKAKECVSNDFGSTNSVLLVQQ